jgi:hypothetical protein
MPAATALAPSRTIACARTVAVVVPSPAKSDDFEATSQYPVYTTAFSDCRYFDYPIQSNGARENPFRSAHFKVRVFDWDPIHA